MATPTERPEVNTVHIHPNEVCKMMNNFIILKCIYINKFATLKVK